MIVDRGLFGLWSNSSRPCGYWAVSSSTWKRRRQKNTKQGKTNPATPVGGRAPQAIQTETAGPTGLTQRLPSLLYCDLWDPQNYSENVSEYWHSCLPRNSCQMKWQNANLTPMQGPPISRNKKAQNSYAPTPWTCMWRTPSNKIIP